MLALAELHVAVQSLALVDGIQIVELGDVTEDAEYQAAHTERVHLQLLVAEICDELFLVFSHLEPYPFERRQVMLDLGMSQFSDVLIDHVFNPLFQFFSVTNIHELEKLATPVHYLG